MAAIPAPLHDRSGHAIAGSPVPSRARRVEILAVTGDDALLEQIGQALDGESTIRPTDSPAEARKLLRPAQPSVLLLDVRGCDDLARVVEDLHSASSTTVVVLFAPGDLSAEVSRAVRGSPTFAVLPIPLEPAQASAVICGALEECLARHALLGSAESSPSPPAAASIVATAIPQSPTFANDTPAEPTPAPVMAEHRPRRNVFFALVFACLAAAVTAIAWISLRGPADASKSTPVPPIATPNSSIPASANLDVAPEALQSGSVDELLESARVAMRERRYTDPEGDNALRYYRSVLAQEPQNGEAREGLLRIVVVLQERVQSALSQRHVDEAARTFAQLRSIRPGDPALAPLEATVVDARLRKAIDEDDVEGARDILRQSARNGTVAPEVIARWQAEIDRQQNDARAEQLARLVALRIRQGQLLQPQGDSAKAYLEQLRRLPNDPQGLASGATTQLQQAYLDKLRDAVGRSQRAETERWQAEARALGVSAAELAAVQRDASARATVAAARQQESARLARLVQDRIAGGRLLEPAGDSALFHLNALRALDPGAAATGERALSARLLDGGRGALAAQQLEVARADAAAARNLGLNIDDVAALERDIAAASTLAAADKTREPARLKRTRYVAPEYPASALSKQLSGDVHVRITVDAEGRVAKAVVVEATPPKVFDDAAVAAVRRWRYAPLGAKNSGVEATATIDIVFQLEAARK